MKLLNVKNLNLEVTLNGITFPIVRGISFDVNENEILGIVGESGCGKSLTALAIMGLIQNTPIRITKGVIEFNGKDINKMTPKKRRQMMGKDMAMIFQEPMTALNPIYTIGNQISESITQHSNVTRKEAREKSIELLKLVQIDNPETRIDSYPHQLSGGQRQRVMIAMALSGNPKLLIADEPTTALDVTVQKEILDLMVDLQKKTGTAILFISHDLGVISQICDKVAVMYRGKIVETAKTQNIFEETKHPYTQGLLNSLPSPKFDVEELNSIKGTVPSIMQNINGCTFHPRCQYTKDECQKLEPALKQINNEHDVACHLVEREKL